jgi:formamidopyrimidine-DNA glycosylase
VVSTAFIRDFLIGEADIASFSCYSKPPASAGGAFTLAFHLKMMGKLFVYSDKEEPRKHTRMAFDLTDEKGLPAAHRVFRRCAHFRLLPAYETGGFALLALLGKTRAGTARLG